MQGKWIPIVCNLNQQNNNDFMFRVRFSIFPGKYFQYRNEMIRKFVASNGIPG